MLLAKIYQFFSQFPLDQDSWMDLVFQFRNQKYGAYALRRAYKKRMSIGFSASIILVLIVTLWPKISSLFSPNEYFEVREINLDPFSPTTAPLNLPGPPLHPLPKIANSSVKAHVSTKSDKTPQIVKEDVPVVAAKELNTQSPSTDSTMKSNSSQSENTNNTSSSNPGGSSTTSSDAPFKFVDIMPQFPGGTRKMQDFIRTNLRYPPSAVQNLVYGIVVVGFIVDPEGTIKDPKIVKSLSRECDFEALRVVKAMPDWIPGKHHGSAVSVQFRLPIEFQLR
ncbi:MAG: TonB family protein [Saprospiraceae bacterium]|jgi:protein TonB|nr:TonB family protein [Saprospiraceae bacterium]MBL0260827.1 TonB family protein [Saprospiraceae bacterium]